MGRLIPADFDVSALEHSERRVVDALVAGTGDDWLILPTVPFVDRGRDGEVDVVVLDPTRGAVVIEVKGGAIAVRDGRWYQNDRSLIRSPADQAVAGKHALIKKVKAIRGIDGTDRVYFAHAVAFPDAASLPHGVLGPELTQEMVLTADELQWPEQALGRLIRDQATTTPAAVEAVVGALRPNVEFSDVLGPNLRGLSRRLDRQTDDMLRTAEALDANRRVWVEGPAGTGKSRLAMRWARRAIARGERVLLLCFNAPMAAVFANAFEGDPLVTAGGFHDVAMRMLANAGVAIPSSPDSEFWDVGVATELIEHRAAMGTGFDTVIVDEVQDIRPHWFPAIEALLDPDGSNRMYRVGDPSQNVYRVDAGASSDGDWVRFPLSTNCRNTASIARVAARVGGGPTFPGSPVGPPVRFVPVGGLKEVRKRVAAEVALLRDQHRVPASSIAVISTQAQLRDELLDIATDDLPLVRWDDRDEAHVVCETAHRLKGTEWRAVVLASLVDETKQWLPEILYVGVSRATTWLSVVATRPTAALLGIQRAEVRG
jgi:hypothetical protein